MVTSGDSTCTFPESRKPGNCAAAKAARQKCLLSDKRNVKDAARLDSLARPINCGPVDCKLRGNRKVHRGDTIIGAISKDRAARSGQVQLHRYTCSRQRAAGSGFAMRLSRALRVVRCVLK